MIGEGISLDSPAIDIGAVLEKILDTYGPIRTQRYGNGLTAQMLLRELVRRVMLIERATGQEANALQVFKLVKEIMANV